MMEGQERLGCVHSMDWGYVTPVLFLLRKEAANGLDPESGSYWCPDSNNHNAESERWKSLITVGYKVDH